MIYVVSIHSKKKTLTFLESSFWVSLWLFFIVISVFPDLLLGVTGALHFARVFDLLVVLALMVLSIVIFMSYFTQKEAARKLEEFVRDQAISEATPSKKEA
jgi:hypothetical protein